LKKKTLSPFKKVSLRTNLLEFRKTRGKKGGEKLTDSKSDKVVYMDFKTGKKKEPEIEEKKDEMIRLMRLLKIRMMSLRQP